MDGVRLEGEGTEELAVKVHAAADGLQRRQIDGQFPAFPLWTQAQAPCCCWQQSPGSVSPPLAAARSSVVHKQALLFIVLA